MPQIFISYRRDDCSGHAGRLYDNLSRHFGSQSLFMDIDTLEPGEDFIEAIEKAVGSCDVLLALIGRQWVTSTDSQGQRQLENPNDFVRLEIEAALARNIRVVPLLVQGAPMPRPHDLPDSLMQFVRRHAYEIADTRWQFDVERLIAMLEKIQGGVSSVLPPSLPEPLPLPPVGPARVPSSSSPRKKLRNSIGREFVLIPAGEFRMGMENSLDPEKPVHRVRITRPFYLGKYQVTQSQWQAVMDENPSHFKGNLNRPVESVSWRDVRGFLRRLSEKEDKLYRLPTEAEWEYAARAGTKTERYWGDDYNLSRKYVWVKSNSRGKTHPVGQLKPNAWGLYDMCGNVYEWVQDWYNATYYQRSPRDDPRGPEQGRERVVRSNAYSISSILSYCSYRSRRSPSLGSDAVGFRVVMPPPR